MNDKVEGSLSTLAALLVVFTAMLDPRLSLGLSVACLLALGIYHFARTSWRVPENVSIPPKGEPDASDACGAGRRY